MRYRDNLVILTNHLVVHLAGGRHVNPDVTEDLCLAAQAQPAAQPAAGFAIFFRFAGAGQVVRAGRDVLLGEVTVHGLHLAAAAACPAATDRVNIDTQLTGRVQHRGARFEMPAFTRRAENDQRPGGIHRESPVYFLSAAGRRRRPLRRVRPPSAAGSR